MRLAELQCLSGKMRGDEEDTAQGAPLQAHGQNATTSGVSPTDERLPIGAARAPPELRYDLDLERITRQGFCEGLTDTHELLLRLTVAVPLNRRINHVMLAVDYMDDVRHTEELVHRLREAGASRLPGFGHGEGGWRELHGPCHLVS
jgi:hypothetical protein